MADPFTCCEGSSLRQEDVQWATASRCNSCGHLMILHHLQPTDDVPGQCDLCCGLKMVLEALQEVTSVVIPPSAIPQDSILSRTTQKKEKSK